MDVDQGGGKQTVSDKPGRPQQVPTVCRSGGRSGEGTSKPPHNDLMPLTLFLISLCPAALYVLCTTTPSHMCGGVERQL